MKQKNWCLFLIIFLIQPTLSWGQSSQGNQKKLIRIQFDSKTKRSENRRTHSGARIPASVSTVKAPVVVKYNEYISEEDLIDPLENRPSPLRPKKTIHEKAEIQKEDLLVDISNSGR